jgi:hypothetical protein
MERWTVAYYYYYSLHPLQPLHSVWSFLGGFCSPSDIGRYVLSLSSISNCVAQWGECPAERFFFCLSLIASRRKKKKKWDADDDGRWRAEPETPFTQRVYCSTSSSCLWSNTSAGREQKTMIVQEVFVVLFSSYDICLIY